ncbi:HlyIII-domain-containing protein [Rhodocollybia butyracea]|uniref:HlyIII-domain-containing protein n=1 Tax=Rhodocollybia butyracea TaxID=206335 RepID=A0A9P5P395_9AGAR|nr:HlyIII-domain-containing protein [Rhodocollybia butyracea]
MVKSSIRYRFSAKNGFPVGSCAPVEKTSVVQTVSRSELPEWQHPDKYILFGYRRTQYHWRGCIHSVFAYLHNETMNIHSHLWGGVLFLYLLGTVQTDQLTAYETTWLDSVLFALFFLSALFCLFSSALYHTSICHSQEVESRCHGLDYIGITVLNLGSHYPLLYYGFFCEPHYQKLYIFAITALNLAGVFVVLDPEYAKPTHIGIRTTIFVALGFFSSIAIIHLSFIHGVSVALQEIGFQWFILSGSFYTFGALLYANRIPERFSPGSFDYFFSSHQILHGCVVLGAYLHYVFITIALNHYHSQTQCRITYGS